MVVKATLSGAAVREAIAELREIDPKLFNALKRDIKQSADGVASGIVSAFPSEGELSGLRYRGRTSYLKPTKATPSFTPGRARAGRVSSLISIKLKVPERVGAWIAELAGMRGKVRVGGQSRPYANSVGQMVSHTLNGQGAYLIDRLNRRTPMAGQGGRYGWAYFVSQKDELHRRGIEILELAVEQLNRSK